MRPVLVLFGKGRGNNTNDSESDSDDEDRFYDSEDLRQREDGTFDFFLRHTRNL